MILLVFSCLVVTVTLLNMMGILAVGGTNVILAVIVLIIAIRATFATYKLHGRFAGEDSGHVSPE